MRSSSAVWAASVMNRRLYEVVDAAQVDVRVRDQGH
jgi:hypothetical protein